ncbi:hypothetical protein N0V82_008886 [Gnomoniopsis sp. IMI 355080]|nr:hypothetical protein N0V82_008886 [Gnomoniopsis sp. IMI 355080]
MVSPIETSGRKTVPGLGIAQPGSAGLMRQASYHGLIEHAAPIGGPAEDSYFHDTSQANRGPKRKLSPGSSPESIRTPADDIRHSIHSAWDRAALGDKAERSIDAISLDSLQIRDEDEADTRDFGPSLTPGPDEGFATDQTPLRSKKKPPKHVRIRRRSWMSVWLIIMSVYSTIMSGIWLFVAIVEPRWGSTVSTNGPVSLSTASLLIAIFAKTIEMSFVTLVMAFVGQVLMRRAIATHEGMTMAEVTMRTWIAQQPGTIFNNLGAVQQVGRSLLGIVALVATLVVMFYTTASDTMVRPKLQFSKWEKTDLNSTVWASYANPTYVNDTCTTPISVDMDPIAAGESCLAIQYSGDWVYRAATNRTLNGILQPSDLDGVGSYNISASVVSPAVNVMCVNMDEDELAPLVYTAWPNANITTTTVANQTKGWEGWESDVPSPEEWSNTTVVDSIFRWGTEYERLPPVFQMFPSDYNTIANDTGTLSDSVYVLGKKFGMDNYTLCQLHSWPAIQCSTRFNVSGTSSMAMSADCAQDVDYFPENATLFKSNPDAYVHTMAFGSEYSASSRDWKDMLQEWTLGISLNGGLNNDNAAVARILTELALSTSQLNDTLPSLAEALASLVANTLITGALDTPFVHYYAYNETLLSSPEMVSFKARVRSQEYASWHTEPWQGIFYAVLVAAFLLNVLCLVYLCSLGLVKDFLEPSSLFALATRESMAARTPDLTVVEKGPWKSNMSTPYLLNYREDEDHFFFEEAAGGGGGGGKTPRLVSASGLEGTQASKRKSFGISFDAMRRLPGE